MVARVDMELYVFRPRGLVYIADDSRSRVGFSSVLTHVDSESSCETSLNHKQTKLQMSILLTIKTVSSYR